jgi:hypothetical protein
VHSASRGRRLGAFAQIFGATGSSPRAWKDL